MSILLKLVISLLLCFTAAGLGGFATSNSLSDWYLTINKPSFNPPGWIFGPVWTILYAAMAIALWKVWSLPATEARQAAMIWFFVQLSLNVLWSFLFFYWEWPLGAFIEILIMWFAILMTIIHFYSLIPWTLALLLPYLLWVSFAAFLNGTIYWIN